MFQCKRIKEDFSLENQSEEIDDSQNFKENIKAQICENSHKTLDDSVAFFNQVFSK